ncbi:MAG: transposase [Edaphobacter sp.]
MLAPVLKEAVKLTGEPALIVPVVGEQPTLPLKRTQEKRERRLGLYREVISLIDAGMSQSEAARKLGLGLRTVQRWVSYGVFPERKQRVFPNAADAYGPYLSRRFGETDCNATQLWREISDQGFTGHASCVWHWLRKRFGLLRAGSATPKAKRLTPVSPHRVAWLMLKADGSKHRYLTELYRMSPELASPGKIARDLFDMIRRRDSNAWPGWLETAELSPLAAFARRLRRDQNAVTAALQLPWSNGMVEGQIHRLKLIKRQMYGRAGFDLLRQRVLHQV